MHEMRKVMWKTHRTHLNFMCEESLSSFDYEVLLRIVRTGLRGMGWWQRCWILFQTETLCFLQGLCSSVQIWAKAFPNGLPVTLQQAHAPRPVLPSGRQVETAGKVWLGTEKMTPTLKIWIFSLFDWSRAVLPWIYVCLLEHIQMYLFDTSILTFVHIFMITYF